MVVFVTAFMAMAALAHEGEDHSAPPAPPTTSSISSPSLAPRAAAATEEFEVVVVLEGKHLIIYVDRFAGNEPVTQATVELEGAGVKGVAAEAAPGVYVANLAAPLAAGKHPLTIVVEAGETADLLSLNLDIPASPPSASGASEFSRRAWAIAGIVGAIVCGGGVWLALRRRKRGASHA
ncbi:MAG TPA: hypothetical protein VJ001_16220 [Rhodocyclaceae bacterium]|nr:hypothetical protein [Rhodocyclaceae bacterium]